METGGPGASYFGPLTLRYPRPLPYIYIITYFLKNVNSRASAQDTIMLGVNKKKKNTPPFIITQKFYFVKSRSVKQLKLLVGAPPSLPQFYYNTFFNICQGPVGWAGPIEGCRKFCDHHSGPRQRDALFRAPIPKQVCLFLLS